MQSNFQMAKKQQQQQKKPLQGATQSELSQNETNNAGYKGCAEACAERLKDQH